MIGLDFISAGLRVDMRTGSAFKVYGPPGSAELLEALRFELLLRAELVESEPGKAPPIVREERYRCELCGDQIGHGRDGSCVLCPDRQCSAQSGGWCLLCVLARDKFLRTTKGK
jgi:hypothetical protein